MLVFDLRDLAVSAATVDDALPSTDAVWEGADYKPADGVRVTGRLSTAGPGRFYFSGQIAGVALGECRRCLKDVETAVRERVQFLFAQTGEESTDDPDVYGFDPRTHELDLRPAIREQWLLVTPAFAQCRDDCAGLCRACGADLNLGPCGCTSPADERWAALRHATSTGDGDGAP